MRISRSVLFPIASLVAFVGLSTGAAALEACSSDSTTGKRVTLTLSAAAPEATAGFTNALGWKVSLDTAAIAVGPTYFFDGPSLFSEAEPTWNPFALKTAYAHPGHYLEGSAMGQVLVAGGLDLKAPDLALAGDGVSGNYRSARFTFQKGAGGAAAGTLGTNVVVLAGTATKAADTQSFRFELDETDVGNEVGKPIVEGCAFTPEPTDVESNGTITVSFQISQWMDQVDFSLLPTGPVTGPVDKTTLPFRAVARGVKEASTFTYLFTPTP
ncbi:hypothetical protein BH09MYX1_BH09MYX1_45640 [soil metagenome]